MNISTNDTSNDEIFLESRIANIVLVYLSPCILLTGTVANILSIIVLSRKKLRETTTMFYLLILSIADLSVLYTGLLRYWLIQAFDFDLRLLDHWICKLHAFLVYFSLDSASWILVAVTVDRCVSVMKPLKAKLCCTVKISRGIVVLILFVMAAINSHLFFTVELRGKGCPEQVCKETKNMFIFLRQVWPWIDFAVFCFMPIGIMVIANTLIIRKVTSSLRPSQVSNRRGSSTHRIATQTSIRTISSGSIRGNSSFFGLAGDNDHNRRDSIDDCMIRHVFTHSTKIQTSTNVTTMLLFVNLVFVLCTAPIGIYFIGQHYWKHTDLTPKRTAEMSLAYSIVNILQYLNNCVHFFTYCITGKRFRSEFYKIFKRKLN